jgi:hypothetical protein
MTRLEKFKLVANFLFEIGIRLYLLYLVHLGATKAFGDKAGGVFLMAVGAIFMVIWHLETQIKLSRDFQNADFNLLFSQMKVVDASNRLNTALIRQDVNRINETVRHIEIRLPHREKS